MKDVRPQRTNKDEVRQQIIDQDAEGPQTRQYTCKEIYRESTEEEILYWI